MNWIAPVAADVGDRPRVARHFGDEPPVPIGVFEQPVLQVAAVHGEHAADVAILAHRPRLLHQRHVAVVEIDGVHDARRLGELHQLARLAGVHRQRLFAHHVFLRGEDVAVDLEVQVVWRAVVDDLDVRVGQQLLVVAVGFGDRKLVGLALGEVLPALGDGRDFDEAEAAKRLDVCWADETGADDACFDFCHAQTQLMNT
jgi:hypothetical protein